MKTFQQFCQEAYWELNEGVVDTLKQVPQQVKQAATSEISRLRTQPLRTLRGYTTGTLKGGAIAGVKGGVLDVAAPYIKKKLGNNPVTNTAVNVAKEVLPYVSWRNLSKQGIRTGANILRGARTAAQIGGAFGSALTGIDRIGG